jgi:hypothetical protein
MRFLYARRSAPVVFANWTLLLILCLSSTTTFAQNDTTGSDGAADETALDIPSTIQALSKECPMEMARLTPCIDTNADLTTCTECVSNFIVQNGDVLNTDGSQEGRQQDASNTTTSAATDTSTSTSTSCDDIQEALCKGVQQCGSSCGLINSESFFTFGSDCEALFGSLVACVLQSQNIGTDCNFEDSSCLDGQVVSGNAAASVASRDATDRVTSLLMGMIILSLLK